MKRRKPALRAFLGYVWFFLFIAFVITIAAFSVSAAGDMFGENKGAVAAFM